MADASRSTQSMPFTPVNLLTRFPPLPAASDQFFEDVDPSKPAPRSNTELSNAEGHAGNVTRSNPAIAEGSNEEVSLEPSPPPGNQEALLPQTPGDSAMLAAHTQDGMHQVREGNEQNVGTFSVSTEENAHDSAIPSGAKLDTVADQERKTEYTDPTDQEGTCDHILAPIYVPISSYAFRNRSTNQSKLVYDLKYHPLDESIRPTQAAKRRSIHGEEVICLDDASETGFMLSDTDAGTLDLTDESEVEENRKQISRGKKRSRTQELSRAPTRRSSRRTSDKKVCYDMKIHPQDDVIMALSTDDDDDDVQPSSKKRRLQSSEVKLNIGTLSPDRIPKTIETQNHPSSGAIDHTGSDDTTNYSDHASSVMGNSEEVMESGKDVHEVINKTSPPSSALLTPPPGGIRRIEPMEVWKMASGQRYFRHDRDSWPMSPGQPFHIYAETLEDQLAAEAKAASPLEYEHDDKENNVHNPDLDPTPDPRETMSIMPAARYRRSSDDEKALREMAECCKILYDDNGASPYPYGIGGSDGTSDTRASMDGSGPLPDLMRLLASSEGLPRSADVEEIQEKEKDSVIGSFTPSSP